MIRLYGCSFTNWIYPTWADFVCAHYDADVIIYGKPGIGNQTIKKLITCTAEKNDTLIVMLSGSDRLEQGVDKEFLVNNGFYRAKHPVTENFWLNNFKSTDLEFVPLKHNSLNFREDFSLFHALYTQCELIVDMQNICNFTNSSLYFLKWQTLWGDCSTRKKNGGLTQPVNLSRYKKNPVFCKTFDIIDQKKFLDSTEKGLLNFVHKDKRLFEYQNTWDFHPSCYANFLYFKKFVKPELDKKFNCKNNLKSLEEKAKLFSEYYANASNNQELFYLDDDSEFVHSTFYNTRHTVMKQWFSDIADHVQNSHIYNGF